MIRRFKIIDLIGKRSNGEGASVDLVPFLNLFTVLVPFLLTSIVFVQIQFLHLFLPVEASGLDPALASVREDVPLNLIIRVSSEAIRLEANHPIKHNGSIPRTHAEKLVSQGMIVQQIMSLEDFSTLVTHLTEIKEDYPNEYAVTIMAEDNVTYNTLITVMDCARLDNRFPVISFSKWE